MTSSSNPERTGHAGPMAAPARAGRLSPALAGRYCLVKDMNCASATLEAFQDVFGLRDDLLLKAVTGLEGGVVAEGATCGVVTAGALGLAQLWRETAGHSPVRSPVLMALNSDYVAWFEASFGTTLCRERTGVDFHTPGGLARYFLPGDRVLRCISHIGTAMVYLKQVGAVLIEQANNARTATYSAPCHCASEVLRDIRKRTGLGDRRIEEIASVLSGGVGFSGGVCGALAGAVMGINLFLGMDVRQYGRIKIMRDFSVGHINLLIDRPRWMPEPFGVGRQIVRRFHERAGSLACRVITGRSFTDTAAFSAHMSQSVTCRKLITLSSRLAAEAIGRWG